MQQPPPRDRRGAAAVRCAFPHHRLAAGARHLDRRRNTGTAAADNGDVGL